MKLNGFSCAMHTSTGSWIVLFLGLFVFLTVCDCAVVNPDALILETSPPFVEEVEVGTVPSQNRRDRGDQSKRRNKQRPTTESDTQPSTEDKPDLPNGYPSLYNPDDVQLGCTELRSKRYISDGFCTSMKPITEVVCAGECLPVRNLPWYAEYVKVWSTEKTKEWRCVNDIVRHKRVHLRCENGERRTYRIRTVRSCKCKKYNKKHNESRLDIINEHDASRSERRKNRQKEN
ncbi:sclerostin domain-containing protein 1-like [Anneissia japonica]|uniref:sclerostin domain-containing protein 1-like n=1 Tax=Anneissia japonica TaxID=1529436 RepID=UPI0014258CAA|nr:sclerostin domain-containing protein 1-like [Anneissia japonica]